MTERLIDHWNRMVAAGPDASAVIDAASGRVWTRGEIDDAATAWSRTHDPLCAGQLVAFSEINGVGWLRVFIGLLKADAVAVPLDPGEPACTQREVSRRIKATALWSVEQMERLAPARRRFRDGRRVVKLTSGSTGTPRPLLFTDGQMLADGRQICAAMGIRPDDLNLGLIPWGHSYGLGNLILPLLLQGTALVAGVAPLPHAIAAAAASWRPTVFPAVPAILRALADSTVAAAELASLRTVISAGAPLPPETARAFTGRFNRKVHNFYGSSETGGITYDASGDSARPCPACGSQWVEAAVSPSRAKPYSRFGIRSAASTACPTSVESSRRASSCFSDAPDAS